MRDKVFIVFLCFSALRPAAAKTGLDVPLSPVDVTIEQPIASNSQPLLSLGEGGYNGWLGYRSADGDARFFALDQRLQRTGAETALPAHWLFDLLTLPDGGFLAAAGNRFGPEKGRPESAPKDEANTLYVLRFSPAGGQLWKSWVRGGQGYENNSLWFQGTARLSLQENLVQVAFTAGGKGAGDGLLKESVVLDLEGNELSERRTTTLPAAAGKPAKPSQQALAAAQDRQTNHPVFQAATETGEVQGKTADQDESSLTICGPLADDVLCARPLSPETGVEFVLRNGLLPEDITTVRVNVPFPKGARLAVGKPSALLWPVGDPGGKRIRLYHALAVHDAYKPASPAPPDVKGVLDARQDEQDEQDGWKGAVPMEEAASTVSGNLPFGFNRNCPQRAEDMADPAYLVFQRKLETSRGPMAWCVQGDWVNGVYSDQGNEGRLRAAIDIKSMSIHGDWSQEPTYQSPNDAGEVEFRWDQGMGSFIGRWRQGPDGAWREGWMARPVE